MCSRLPASPGCSKQMVAEVSSIPAASAVKKPFGLRSKMGKWCHHCFPCCRGSGKSNVGTSGDQDDSAMKTHRSKMAKWCSHCFPCCRGSGESILGPSGDQEDPAMKTHRSKMAKWCCHGFPRCKGHGESDVEAWEDYDDSAFMEPRYHVPSCKGRGESNVEAWEDYDDSAFMEPRYHVRGEDLDKLHRAAWWGKVPRKDLIVMLRDTDVNKTDKQKRTALHLASANGNSEIVKLLLDRRCQLDVLDNKKRTALIKAVQCQEDECALMLLEHGTDPNIPDEYGNTALHYAIYNEDKLMAKALLLYGADIESKNKHGLTPLLLGVHGQKQQVVKFLIKKKANLSARDRCGRICQLLSDYKEKQMLKISSENSNPVLEQRGQTCGGIMYSSGGKDAVEKSVKSEGSLKKEAEEDMKKHGSNNTGLPENLTNDAAAGNGDDGLIPQSKSRTPESQQFPDTENEEYHSDEQNDTQKQVSEEQNAGISQEEILTGKQEQMEVAEKKMNSEVSLTNEKEKDLLHENRMLQEEIAMLRLEVDKIKQQSQLREKKLLEEIESVKAKNEKLLKAVKLSKTSQLASSHILQVCTDWQQVHTSEVQSSQRKGQAIIFAFLQTSLLIPSVELPLLPSEYQGSKDPKCHIDTSNKLQLTQGTHQSISHSDEDFVHAYVLNGIALLKDISVPECHTT
ncbi:putative POTE ankyrin domain family member M [Macaca mulatta]